MISILGLLAESMARARGTTRLIQGSPYLRGIRGIAGPPVGLAEIRLSSSALNCITCREYDAAHQGL